MEELEIQLFAGTRTEKNKDKQHICGIKTLCELVKIIMLLLNQVKSPIGRVPLIVTQTVHQ